MMRLALDRCFSNAAVGAVLIDPLAHNSRACCFYERLGFRPVGPRTFGNDACIVYRNVPMNTALARVAAASPEAARYWPEYVSRWTLWNHLRMAASLAAMVCFIAALRQP